MMDEKLRKDLLSFFLWKWKITSRCVNNLCFGAINEKVVQISFILVQKAYIGVPFSKSPNPSKSQV